MCGDERIQLGGEARGGGLALGGGEKLAAFPQLGSQGALLLLLLA